MIPIEIEKWRFACRLYNMKRKDRDAAAHKLRREYEKSPVLQKHLASVGYIHANHKLRRVDLLVYQEDLLLPDDFWD